MEYMSIEYRGHTISRNEHGGFNVPSINAFGAAFERAKEAIDRYLQPRTEANGYRFYYVWHMNDGRWHISPMTDWQFSKDAPLPTKYDMGYETEDAARAALKQAKAEADWTQVTA